MTSVLVVLLIWEAVGRSGIVHISLFPPPSHVVRALTDMAKSGELARDAMASGKRAFLGILLGSITGVCVGMVTGRVKSVDYCISPIINLFRPLPPVALIPLVLVWFGIGEISKVVSISFAVFFPVWINTHLGSREIPKTFFWSAKTFRMNSMEVLRRIVFPGSLPFVIAGVRNGIAIAFVMVFVSELAGASSGIGYQIQVSHLAYRVDRMMAALVVLGGAGAATDCIVTRVAWFIFPWLKLSGQK